MITEGRMTLPTVILLVTVGWFICSLHFPTLPADKGVVTPLWQWARSMFFLPFTANRWIAYAVYGVVGYMLIELNNTFSIIRIRASVQTSFFLAFVTICPLLQQINTGMIACIPFVISLFFLLRSYQQPLYVSNLFHSFVFLGVASLIVPQLNYLVIIWLLTAISFQSLSFRGLFAALLGWIVPYFLLVGHAYYHEQPELIAAPFLQMINVEPLQWDTNFPLWQMIMIGYLLIVFISSLLHCISTGYEDKIRTRSYLNFFIFLSLIFFAALLLQPQLDNALLPLLFVTCSILTGHLFALTATKLSNIFFIANIVALLGIFILNVWFFS